jgi:hypothetical protein
MDSSSDACVFIFAGVSFVFLCYHYASFTCSFIASHCKYLGLREEKKIWYSPV